MKETKFKQTDIGLIPEDWNIEQFEKVFALISTNTFSREFMNEKAGCVHNIHYGDILVKYGSIVDFEKDAVPYLKDCVEFYSESNRLQDGDIIIADTAEDETAGKTAEIFNLNKKKAVAGLHTFACRPKIVFAPKYLGYFTNCALFHNQMLPYFTGTKVTSISKSSIVRISVVYPPTIKEQGRIANALCQIDDLIEALDEQIEKKKLIKQGAMQQLLTGKTRLKGFSGEWEIVKLGDVAEMNSGGTPSSRNPHYYGGMINFLSISDMTNSGKFIFSTEKTITQLGLDNSSAREFPAGTLMYAMYASLGKCSITKINTAVSQAILGFKLSKRMDRDFLYYYFCFIEESVKKMGQTGTQSNLSKKIVEDFEIYVSKDISEQQAIASTLSTMDEEIQTLQEERDKYALVKQGMMQQLLTGKIRLN